MELKDELMRGNLVLANGKVEKMHCISEEWPFLDTIEYGVGTIDWKDIEPIELTEDWLIACKFQFASYASYINGRQFQLQVTRDYEEEGINRDGTWFDGIGVMGFEKTGHMVVNTLCKGNYVCGSAEYVHELQNLFFWLSRNHLPIDEIKLNEIKSI
jgi:hypothetical protein